MYKNKIGTPSFYIAVIAVVSIASFGIYLLANPDSIPVNKKNPGSEAFLPSFLLLVVVPFLVYPLIQRPALVSVDASIIKIKRLFQTAVILYPGEISSIELTARKSLGFFRSSERYSGINIITKNGIEYFIADSFITDVKMLKQEIELFRTKNNIELITPPLPEPISLASIDSLSSEEKFAGIYLFSMNGILFLFMLSLFWIFLPMNLHSESAKGNMWVLPAGSLLFYLSFGTQAYYFILSDQELIVKNHLLFWVKKKYDIDDICRINVESQYRRSDFLMIVFKDYSEKRFTAGSLGNKHWQALKKRLTAMNIPVSSKY